MSELIYQFAPLAVFLVLVFVGLRFILKRSHSGMDTSIEMQKDAMQGQADAIAMGREGIELQKEMLSEMRDIKKLLEKR